MYKYLMLSETEVNVFNCMMDMVNEAYGNEPAFSKIIAKMEVIKNRLDRGEFLED